MICSYSVPATNWGQDTINITRQCGSLSQLIEAVEIPCSKGFVTDLERNVFDVDGKEEVSEGEDHVSENSESDTYF